MVVRTTEEDLRNHRKNIARSLESIDLFALPALYTTAQQSAHMCVFTGIAAKESVRTLVAFYVYEFVLYLSLVCWEISCKMKKNLS